MKAASAKMDTVALVGDACLFTAAAFCPLVLVGGPLALVIGPAAAWLLHDRRIDWAAVISEVIGIVISVVVVSGLFVLVSLVSAAVGPIGGREFAVPAAFLATVGTAFLALIVVLDIDGVGDLSPARHRHIRLDYARLASTLVIAMFVVVVSLVQTIYPETETGDAGVLAFGAASVGAVRRLTMKSIHGYWEKRSGSAIK
jgi:hypothetical protein